jgi:hypothetical protein
MSFLSVLAGIGRRVVSVAEKGLGVVSTVAAITQPFVAILGPEASAIDGVIVNAIGGAEMLISTAQAGAVKKQTATQIVYAELPNVQALVTAFGSGFVIPQAELSALIDASVSAKNALAVFLAAVKPKAA